MLSKSEILEAIKGVTDEKLKARSATREFTQGSQAVAPGQAIMEAVMEKTGPKILLLESRTIDGTSVIVHEGRYTKTSEPVALSEKCLD